MKKVTTYAKKATDELDTILYQDTGMYRPWQFVDGTTEPMLLDSVIEDTITYWNEPAKLRPEFKTEDKVVYIPVFFTKINGIYKDVNEYYKLVEKIRKVANSVFYETPHFSTAGNKDTGQTRTIRYHNVSLPDSDQVAKFKANDLAELEACLDDTLTINREKLKSHALYRRFMSLRSELQTFLLNKLEETFETLSKDQCVRLMALLFTIDDNILKLLDKFDFTSDIPKLIFYLNGKDNFNEDDTLLLLFLRNVGMDILFFCPNGACNIDISPITVVTLEQFVDNLSLKEPKEVKNTNGPKKESFMSKFFKGGN